ncbi:MAG: DegV family EDD domain-containing protein [Candidatus Heimdallarchaeota archaeon]|nr:DegV family EDD domain-containing protein [Candidatus Heimdallarchaeota archaeon]
MKRLQKVKIITDSSCDLTLEQYQKYNVDFVPAYAVIEGKKYKQHYDITTDELYEKLIIKKKSISTAVPSPQDFFKVYEKATTEAESVIAIFLTKKLSGLFQTGALVAKKYFQDEDLTLIDAKSCSLAQGLLVMEAAEMAQKGKSKAEIISRLEHLSKYAHAFAMVDTLEYLHRGGRIRLYKKLIGDLLRVKPVIQLDKTGANLEGHIRGREKGMLHMKMFGLRLQDHLKNKRMFVAYTDNKSLADEIAKFLNENGQENIEVLVGQLGSVVGVHGGPDVVGYGFIGKYHPDMFFKPQEVAIQGAQSKFKFPSKG